MEETIKVAIIDDHQSIIDGYVHRLESRPEVEVVASGLNGEDLQTILSGQPVDVLLLDLNIPSSPKDPNPYPIFHALPALLRTYPQLKIIVISMFTQLSLVKAMFDLGISAYIFKDDQVSIQLLGNVIKSVAEGGVYMSQGAYPGPAVVQPEQILTPRQLEALSLCMAYPNLTTNVLAVRLNISTSTCRNLLSGAYQRLGVQNRAAAIAEAQRLGILPGVKRLEL
jgi:two-component system capsular synthesis response regulator RcsB